MFPLPSEFPPVFHPPLPPPSSLLLMEGAGLEGLRPLGSCHVFCLVYEGFGAIFKDVLLLPIQITVPVCYSPWLHGLFLCIWHDFWGALCHQASLLPAFVAEFGPPLIEDKAPLGAQRDCCGEVPHLGKLIWVTRLFSIALAFQAPVYPPPPPICLGLSTLFLPSHSIF